MERSSLEMVKTAIEGMDHSHQVEVLSLLRRKGTVAISENQNGCFINLTAMRPSDLRGLEEYVHHVAKQQQLLAEGEREKATLLDEFFNKDKDMPASQCNES